MAKEAKYGGRWFTADRELCLKCGRITFVCALCGERRHRAEVGEQIGPGEVDEEYSACDECAPKIQAMYERKLSEN